MDWQVRFSNGDEEQIVEHPTPEEAIEAACHALDRGAAVQSIAIGDAADFVGPDVIGRIYEMWVRAKDPRRLGGTKPEPSVT